MAAGLGVFELYANGRRIGQERLKPGFTHNAKTKYAFTYDITDVYDCKAGNVNLLTAEVSAGWWRDKIVNFVGKKSAFRSVLELTYSDGSTEYFGTTTAGWQCCIGGPVTHAAIFDGEEYDARLSLPAANSSSLVTPEKNTEFAGDILPSDGAEVYCRYDLALTPKVAYCWKGCKGAGEDMDGQKVHGTVCKTKEFAHGAEMTIMPGETLVLDFAQNCAAVPEFLMSAPRGTVLTCLPGEMLNDANGESARGNDGPSGSVYRANLRCPEDGMRAVYTFNGNGDEYYQPRFSFFGYRYVSITATDTVTIRQIRSVPVTSIAADMELGTLETGNRDINQLISNIRWGQLSNYLSVPTDCPQRNERLGWTADAQVFAEAGTFNAATYQFFRKWMRDMRDSQHDDGSFPSVAPYAQYGNEGHRLGWADAGVIMPYICWKQFGDTQIIQENFAAMERFLEMQAKDNYRTVIRPDGSPDPQYADWLSFEDYESSSGRSREVRADGTKHVRAEALQYWNYLAGCFWYGNTQLMQRMAQAIGNEAAVAKYAAMEQQAFQYLQKEFIDPADGQLIQAFRHLQGASVFALKYGLLQSEEAIQDTKERLLQSFADHGGCLQTGFLSTAILPDTLTRHGLASTAYDLLFQHKNPSWLYSVDQGATTVWERWDSYCADRGFGAVGMNSFNHYAYGSVLAWIWRTAAGIAADDSAPGFRNIIMAPIPDKRLGYVKASYRSPQGIITSAWHYEGDTVHWNFEVPEGATATVILPGEKQGKKYPPGKYNMQIA
jgi:alpha-L-rhamnosidase